MIRGPEGSRRGFDTHSLCVSLNRLDKQTNKQKEKKRKEQQQKKKKKRRTKKPKLIKTEKRKRTEDIKVQTPNGETGNAYRFSNTENNNKDRFSGNS